MKDNFNLKNSLLFPFKFFNFRSIWVATSAVFVQGKGWIEFKIFDIGGDACALLPPPHFLEQFGWTPPEICKKVKSIFFLCSIATYCT